MMLIGGKTRPVLVWGMCVLLSVNSTSASTPENGTDGPATLRTTADNEEEAATATWAPSHKPAAVNGVTAEVSRKSPAGETEKELLAAIGSSVGTASPTAARTGAASVPSVQLSHSSTAATAANQTAPSPGGTTVAEGVKQTEGKHQQPATIVTSGAAPAITSAPLWTLEVSTPPAAVAELGNGSELSTATSLRKEKPVSLHSDRTPLLPTASTGAINPAPLSPVVFSAKPAAVTELENRSELSSPASSESEKPIIIHEYRTPSVPAASTGAINPTSGAASTYKTRSPPNDTTEAHISTDGSHVPRVSPTSRTPLSPSQSAASSSPPTVSISTEPPGSSAAASTSPAAIPPRPKRLPNPKAETSPASAATPGQVSKSTPGTRAHTCSDRSTAKHCLIVIACLALLATIFMVSTIALCAKLSAKKQRAGRSQPGTEMMCISALLPERSYSFRRQHNAVSNGVLVLPRTGDSDEDGGDNLTLSSFLPDNDHYV